MTINRANDCNNNRIETGLGQPARETSMATSLAQAEQAEAVANGQVVKEEISTQANDKVVIIAKKVEDGAKTSPRKPRRAEPPAPNTMHSSHARHKSTLPPVDNCETIASNTRPAMVEGTIDRAKKARPAPQPQSVALRKASPARSNQASEQEWKVKLNRELLAYQQQLNRQMDRHHARREQALAQLVSLDSGTPSPTTLTSGGSSRPDSGKSRSSQTSSESSKVTSTTNSTSRANSSAHKPKVTIGAQDSDAKAKAAHLVAVSNLSHNKSKSDVKLATETCDTLAKHKHSSKSAQGERGTGVSDAMSTVRPRVKMETPYERIVHALNNDRTWLKEVSFGRRIGFYRFRGDIGYGNFSQVKVAVHILTKEKVAVKILNKSRLDLKTQAMLKREIKTMEALHHPNLIQIFEVVETVSKHYIIMELAEGGELFNVITEQGRLVEKEAKFFFAQIVSAIEHMHQHNLIHRDIKAENVFFADAHTIKVGDFGFSTRITSGDQLLSTYCGSPPYAAPELFRDECYRGPQVDYWALGVLLYFIVTATMPFKASTIFALKRLILDCRYDIPSYVSVECCQLIAGFLQLEPGKRYNLEQAKCTRWLRNQLPSFAYTRYDMKSSLGRYHKHRRATLAKIEGDSIASYETLLANNPRSHRPLPRQQTEPPLLDVKRITPPEDMASEKAAGIISDEERETFHKLAELGINEEMLVKHFERGSASHIVGMFRILLHRERQAAPRRARNSIQRVQSLKTSPLRGEMEVTDTTRAHFNNPHATKLTIGRNSTKPLERFWSSKKGVVNEATLKHLALTANNPKQRSSPKATRRQNTDASQFQSSDSESSKKFSLKRIFSINDSSGSNKSRGNNQPAQKVIHHHIVEVKTITPPETKTSTTPKDESHTKPTGRMVKQCSVNSNDSTSSNKTRPPTGTMSNKRCSLLASNSISSNKENGKCSAEEQNDKTTTTTTANGGVQRTDQSSDIGSMSSKKSIRRSNRLSNNIVPMVHETKVVSTIPTRVHACSPLSSFIRGLNGRASGLRRARTTPNVAECFREDVATLPSPSRTTRRAQLAEHVMSNKHSHSTSTVKQRAHCRIV